MKYIFNDNLANSLGKVSRCPLWEFFPLCKNPNIAFDKLGIESSFEKWQNHRVLQ